jgi:predicted alpha/beta-fold hydrolase
VPSPPAPFTPTEPFTPAAGLASPDAQTIFGSLARPAHRPPLRRERWDTPDDDFVDVDLLAPREEGGPHAPHAPHAPHVVVLHGLEGSSHAGYVLAVLREAAARGWGATAVNFRSCSGELNHTPRFYHSGDTADALAVLQKTRARVRGPLVAVGFSLGGSVLLGLLAEQGAAAPVDAAVAISAPYDLTRCSAVLDGPGFFMRIYRERFLRKLKRKALLKLERFPQAFDRERVARARTLREFDEAVTAPMHGFRDAADYYARASAGPRLSAIRRPTLLLSAEDDPIVPPAGSIPPAAADNPHLTVLRTPHGGHVGFVGGSVRAPRFWAEAQALHFLSGVLGR